MAKLFLDVEGLELYDQLIKEYIAKVAPDSESQQQIIQDLATYKDETDAKIEELAGFKSETAQTLEALASFQTETVSALESLNTFKGETEQTVSEMKESISTVEESAQSNKEAIEVLNGEGEGSVKKAVADAVASIVDNAPEIYDTLKELSDWIANNETGTAELVAKVSSNEKAIEEAKASVEDVRTEMQEALKNLGATEEIKAYVDAQDQMYFDQIGSIYNVSIEALFKTKVTVSEGQSVNEAIGALKEDEMLVLSADDVISEDVIIPANVVINGNGATFTGSVTIDKSAMVENAVFNGVVTVA